MKDQAFVTGFMTGRELESKQSQSIRVWAVCREYHPIFAGGAIQGHRILRQLVRNGFVVNVLTGAHHEARSLAGETAHREGVVIRYLPVLQYQKWDRFASKELLRKIMSTLNRLISNLTLNFGVAWSLWREGNRDDIVQLFSSQTSSFLIIWLARALGMHPVIRMSLVGSDDPGSFNGGALDLLRLVRLEAYRKAEAIIGNSSALADSCRSAGLDPERVFRIPNGVDLERFHPVAEQAQVTLCERLKLRPHRRYIVFVGAAKHRKGIDVLIRAFIILAEKLDDVDLLIVGPCDFSEDTRDSVNRQRLVGELRQEVAEAGHSSRVHWLGKVDDVYRYLQVADLFCLPTRREGLPNAVAEAMAVGLPIVTSHLEGVTTDLICSEVEGVLVEEHNPDRYAEAMTRLLEDPAKAGKMAKAAQARAIADFDVVAVSARYASLYRQLLERARV